MNPAVEAARKSAEAKRLAAEAATASAPAAEVIDGEATPIPTNTSTAVAAAVPLQVAPRLTMGAMNTGRLSNDGFIKMKHEGFMIGEGCKSFIDKFRGEVVMIIGKGYVPMYTIKFGNPTQYESTVDGVTSRKGQSWQAVLDRARAIDPNAAPYPSAEVVVELLEDVGTMKAGDKLGISLATTNFQDWEEFYNECAAKGYEGKTIEIEVRHKPKQNAKGKWGVAQFKMLSVIED